jgi:lipid II:glycine glycyltransferase (peptidoglycan interpeptide bridge formation enzyme)/dTDP-4-amino-4,6-dideoxygalactose transaminase
MLTSLRRRLVLAPLPSWRDWWKAIFTVTMSDEELCAPWIRSEELAFLFSRSSWSLVALVKLRQQILNKKNIDIWVPDYFCNVSLTPLREMGVNLVFYPITEQKSPDVPSLQNLADQHSIDIFIIVHYFGQPNSAEIIASFCEAHDAWLVEDATHVLQPINNIGNTGDFVIYSPHKHLPIFDGAVLLIRKNGSAKLTLNSQTIEIFHKIRNDLITAPGKSHKLEMLWLLKRVSQLIGFHGRSKMSSFDLEPTFPNQQLPHPSMSSLAKRLLSSLIEKIDLVATSRQSNYQTWIDIFSKMKLFVNVKPDLATMTPYMASFSVTNAFDAKVLFNRLQQLGLPVMTWPDLPAEVITNKAIHHTALAFRNICFYLPVHQSLSQNQILECGKKILDLSTDSWKIRYLSFEDWEKYWSSCSQVNIIQSWQYGAAREQIGPWKARRYLILDQKENPIALAQILFITLPLVGGIARLNRGPILLVDSNLEDEEALKLRSIEVLVREARRQRWWLFQLAPEMTFNESYLGLKALGLKQLKNQPWTSGRIFLLPDENSLLMDLEGKWRNQLRKGQKLGVTVTHSECNANSLTSLMEFYTDLQNNRKFTGLSKKLIHALAMQRGAKWQFNIFFAHEQFDTNHNNPLGVLVTIRSGDTVIYLIGSTSFKGRQMQANSVLLWQAILQAKEAGASWFDIGGLNDLTPKGVAEYKRGLNSQPYKLIGEWRKWF